jgi:hypothetical protein
MYLVKYAEQCMRKKFLGIVGGYVNSEVLKYYTTYLVMKNVGGCFLCDRQRNLPRDLAAVVPEYLSVRQS